MTITDFFSRNVPEKPDPPITVTPETDSPNSEAEGSGNDSENETGPTEAKKYKTSLFQKNG